LEKIDFVEEEDHGCSCEPPRIADLLEDHERFFHIVLSLELACDSFYLVGIFFQYFIVSRDANKKDTASHLFEAMYPLPPF